MNAKSLPLTLAGFALLGAGPVNAQTGWVAKSLLQFDSATGYSPNAGVVTDQFGTVFGTTSIGGNGPCLGGAGCGTVFALSRSSSTASWVFAKLYDFQGGQDGSSPFAPLTVSSTGAVYGYTAGGTYGTVFRLLPPAQTGGSWTFQILYVFSGGADGNLESVTSPLVFRAGALYGIASGGSKVCGQIGCGSVFRLMPGAAGAPWSFTTLFSFQGSASSGEPNWIVGADTAGPLYVSTSFGFGAIAELLPAPAQAPWVERVLTRFQGGSDGRGPYGLVLAPDGTLYGLALTAKAGQVFQLRPPASPAQAWNRTTIASVSVRGYGPTSLALGDAGSLIGAIEGDFDFFAGAVFELVPPSAGTTWTFTELWNFDRGPDRNPLNVVTGLGGNLFGVLEGGDSTNGSLFALYTH
jgi:hypothetical protein